MRNTAGIVIAGLLVAAAIAFAALEFSRAFVEVRTVVREVSVKGLAEQDVKADLSLWPLKFTTTNDDLAAALANVAADEATVRKFLAAGGIEEGAVSVQQFAVIDQLAQQYRSGPVQSRYIVSQALLVRTGDVDAVSSPSKLASWWRLA